ncbi:hypothetical protein K435DRAFT_386518 [Dendrothele bispora CBS 962.96]|uniref:Uncharacterized protein n=1 Tax=Dendrothele bispora (strain CBS 962.96) TaxID=1314807 RepID=A0A4S8LAC8_DENBC|nr:hypothetical protein K435DRAFT_386518 [Dendrothele bispora CBS 962.96]
MSDQVWKVVEQCWDHQPAQRLKTDRVVEWMRVLSDLANLQTLPGTSMPMLPFTNENWNNLDTINKSTETTLFPQPLRMYWQHDYPDLPPVSPTSPTTPLPTPSRSESWIADDTLLDVENSGGSFKNPIENVNGRMVIPVSRLTSPSDQIHQSDQILTALGSEAHNTGLLKNTKFAYSSNCTLELEQALDKRLSFKPDNLLQNSQPVVPQSYAPILALLFMCFLFRSFALLYLILSCLLAWHLV